MVEAKYDLANLQKLCPLADICPTNRSDKQRMEMKNSCCLPCKCDAMCSEIGNCCSKSNSYGYMCHSPYVEDETNRDLGYFMVDTCPNKSTFTDCLGEEVAPWGTLYPVYDPVTDRNFYNNRCAECSGIYNYIFWDLNLEPLTFDLSLSTCLNALSGGRQHGCRIGFAPPKDMNKMDQACSSDLISSCNFTGLWSQYDTDLERACAMMYSPVRDHSGYPEYANDYCALCNGVNYVLDDVCYSINDGFDIPSRLPGSHNPLSMLLDYEKVESVINSASIPGTTVSNNGICGKLMVKHPTKVISNSDLK